MPGLQADLFYDLHSIMIGFFEEPPMGRDLPHKSRRLGGRRRVQPDTNSEIGLIVPLVLEAPVEGPRILRVMRGDIGRYVNSRRAETDLINHDRVPIDPSFSLRVKATSQKWGTGASMEPDSC